jgi:hypothetical protein
MNRKNLPYKWKIDRFFTYINK